MVTSSLPTINTYNFHLPDQTTQPSTISCSAQIHQLNKYIMAPSNVTAIEMAQIDKSSRPFNSNGLPTITETELPQRKLHWTYRVVDWENEDGLIIYWRFFQVRPQPRQLGWNVNLTTTPYS